MGRSRSEKRSSRCSSIRSVRMKRRRRRKGVATMKRERMMRVLPAMEMRVGGMEEASQPKAGIASMYGTDMAGGTMYSSPTEMFSDSLTSSFNPFI